MIGAQLHDYEVRLVRYVFGNLVQQIDDPDYLACLKRGLSPTLFAYLSEFAENAAAVPTVLLSEEELKQLREAVNELWDVDDSWQHWEPLHKLSVNCVPEIRQQLTQHHAEEWATNCERFADRLMGDNVRLREGIEKVSEWIEEIHRLLRAMGATALLPRPEGRFPTPSLPGDPDEVALFHSVTPRKEVATSASTSEDSRPEFAGPRSFDCAGTDVGQLLTVKEIADRWQVSRSIVYALVESGDLPHVRVGLGRGTIRITREDTEAYEKKRKRDDETDYAEHFA